MEGDDKYRNKQPHNAIHFYSEGLQVNCRDDQLNAELYSKRAEASFYLGKNVLIFFRTGLTSECIPGLTEVLVRIRKVKFDGKDELF